MTMWCYSAWLKKEKNVFSEALFQFWTESEFFTGEKKRFTVILDQLYGAGNDLNCKKQ